MPFSNLEADMPEFFDVTACIDSEIFSWPNCWTCTWLYGAGASRGTRSKSCIHLDGWCVDSCNNLTKVVVTAKKFATQIKTGTSACSRFWAAFDSKIGYRKHKMLSVSQSQIKITIWNAFKHRCVTRQWEVCRRGNSRFECLRSGCNKNNLSLLTGWRCWKPWNPVLQLWKTQSAKKGASWTGEYVICMENFRLWTAELMLHALIEIECKAREPGKQTLSSEAEIKKCYRWDCQHALHARLDVRLETFSSVRWRNSCADSPQLPSLWVVRADECVRYCCWRIWRELHDLSSHVELRHAQKLKTGVRSRGNHCFQNSGHNKRER